MTREEAINILTNHTQYKCNGDDLVAIDLAIEALEQEPKIGHWKEVNYRAYKALCSNCGTWSPIMGNYCPYCGAKMESEGV